MKGRKVLVIDDDLTMLRMTERLLQNDGYTVIVASRGQMGLERAKRDRPDLILLDVLIPDMNGVEIVNALKADVTTKDIPIVFMTVTLPLKDDQGKEIITINNQSYRTFAKPLHNRKVLSVIRKEINRHIYNNKY